MPATDRELIELAAKAAGMAVNKRDGYVWCEGVGPKKAWGLWRDCAAPRSNDPNPRYLPGRWNPLTDDGDGARLEAALGIDLSWCEDDDLGPGMVVAIAGERVAEVAELYEHHNGDKQAARRRATVRCAAAMAPTSAAGVDHD